MQWTTITAQQFVDGVDTSKLFGSKDPWESFYEKKFYFSYSSLSKLMYCPEVFHKEYILGMKEELEKTYLTEGKLIHSLLLEPDKFEEQYTIMTGKIPSENTKSVIDRVYVHHQELKATGEHKGDDLKDYSNAILDVLLDMNLHQSLKTDEQRLAKICTPDSLIYWKFMLDSFGKTVVDFVMYEKCKRIVDKIKEDSHISKLLCLNAGSEWWSTVEVFNEVAVSTELKQFPFGLKGMLDNVVVDPINKIIRISDVKTTSKTLKDFPDSVISYRYNLQAAIYNLLVRNKYEDLVKEGYVIEFYFVVIDKNEQFYPFMVSEETMKTWTLDLRKTLEKAEYHYTNRSYTLPYEFIKETFIL